MKRLYLPFLAVLALAACAHHADKKADDDASNKASGSLNIRNDGTAYVSGRVTGKQGDCTMSACTLTVASDKRDVRVIYGTSTRPCDAGDAGQTVRIGEKIKAFGRYSRDGEDGIVDVCTGGGGFLEKE